MSRLSGIFTILLCGLVVTEISAESLTCNPPWVEYNGKDGVKCFLWGDEAVETFNEANDFCKSKNGQLASIHSKDENLFIKKYHPSDPSSYWLGYIHKEGKQFWNDEEHEIKPRNYTHFTLHTCDTQCDRAVMYNGDWSKVQESYSFKAKPLCQITQTTADNKQITKDDTQITEDDKGHSFAPESRPLSGALIIMTALISRVLV